MKCYSVAFYYDENGFNHEFKILYSSLNKSKTEDYFLDLCISLFPYKLNKNGKLVENRSEFYQLKEPNKDKIKKIFN